MRKYYLPNESKVSAVLGSFSFPAIPMDKAAQQWSHVSSKRPSTISLTQTETAVKMRNVTISYGRGEKVVTILNHLNMTVPVGVVYGLLGPSGCGKTTLLRCIVGCVQPDNGLVRVFGHKPGQSGSGIPGPGVGYMPQDIALYSDLTVEEMLLYFGRLYSIDYEVLEERINYLTTVMELPEKQQLISQLSGGQKRRASFAAALIHKPRLLLLDEPTVGVDPILRERIWEILVQCTEREKMTVIITTHYIEETKRSHIVGFMRRGRVLAEDSPQALIRTYGAISLEEVFFKLCMVQKRQSKLWKRTSVKGQLPVGITRRLSRDSEGEEENQPPNLMKIPFLLSISKWYVKYMTVTRRIMTQTFRQPAAFFAQFVLPFTSLFFFCMAVGHTPKDIPLGVVNDESPPYLSAIYLKNINPEIISLRNYSKLETAIEAVKRTQIWGTLHIKANFSESLIRRGNPFEEDIDNKTIEEGTMRLYADLTNKILSITIQRTLEEATEAFISESLRELDYNPKLFQFPIKLGSPVFGKYVNGDYFAIRDYGTPGLLVVVTYSCAYGLTVLVLIAEKNDHMFERNFASGVTSTQLVLSHLTSRILFMVINVALYFLMAIYVFKTSNTGSWVGAVFLLMLQSVTGLTHGMMVSAVCSSFFMATILSNFILIFMFILSGALWPVESLPPLFKWISYFQPTTIPTESLRSILARGLGVFSPAVFPGIAVTWSWTLVFFVCSVLLFKFTKR